VLATERHNRNRTRPVKAPLQRCNFAAKADLNSSFIACEIAGSYAGEAGRNATMTIRRSSRAALAVCLTAATATFVPAPASAGDGGAVAAGVIGGLALGALAGSAAAGAYGPPPGYYPAPAPVYYPPPPPPPQCWWEPREVWNGWAFVVRRVRVCE
jgi:hypothetical protein